MNTEDQLRGAFARLVPDPPDVVVEPGVVEARGRRVRRRRAALSVVGVGVLAAALVPLSLHSGRGDSDVTAEPSAAADPFTTDPCPDAFPDGFATGPVPTELHSVRLCDIGTSTRLVPSLPKDALVTGLPDFVARLKQIPVVDPAECTATTPAPPTAVLVLTSSDGGQALVPVMACAQVDVSGTLREALGVHQALLDGLAGQRRELGPPSVGFDTSDLCAWSPTEIAVDPAVESVKRAAICSDAQPDRDLAGDDLQAVREGWRDAVTAPEPNPVGDCFGDTLAVLTDYGDVIRFKTTCAGFVQARSSTRARWLLTLDDSVRDRLSTAP